MNKQLSLILRISLAFAFLYPAVKAYFDPISWLGYFPSFMKGIVPDPVLLHAFGITEVIIALWLLSGRKLLIPSALASLYLLGIVIFNLNGFDVVFRDLSILGIAVALTLDAYTNKRQGNLNDRQS